MKDLLKRFLGLDQTTRIIKTKTAKPDVYKLFAKYY